MQLIEVLKTLRCSNSSHQCTSAALREVHRIFVEGTTEDRGKDEGFYFDFIMEDGIQAIAQTTLRGDLGILDAQLGLEIIIHVSGNDACHWKRVWESLGRLDGAVQLLEIHSMTTNICPLLLKIFTRISQFGLLGVETKDLLQWIPFWDLVLGGVEMYADHNSSIFDSFCYLLTSQSDEYIPLEVRGRISFVLLRSLDTIKFLCECKNGVSRENDFSHCLEDLILRFLSDEHSQVEERNIAEAKWGSIMHVQCAAAA